MNINRLNYENYFLLYVDGELSSAEMQAVERFAAENKDLADELNMLLQTRLPEEISHFGNKSALLRTTSHHINTINCEEKFLFFIDDELTEEEKKETLLFVSTHPTYQELFETIQLAKLPVEHIGFPDKNSLYRKEEKSQPVILIQWWKLAIAAAVVGIIAMVGIFIPFNTTSSVVKTKLNINSKELKNSLNEQPVLLKNKIEAQSQFVQNKKIATTKSALNPIVKSNIEQPIIIEPLMAKGEPTKHIEAEETIAINSTNTDVSDNSHALINSESNSHINLLSPVNKHTEETADRSYVKPAVYKELDTDDERKSLYVGSVEINKDKLRGFLRKASSLFKGRNKNEDQTEISNSHTLE